MYSDADLTEIYSLMANEHDSGRPECIVCNRDPGKRYTIKAELLPKGLLNPRWAESTITKQFCSECIDRWDLYNRSKLTILREQERMRDRHYDRYEVDRRELNYRLGFLAPFAVDIPDSMLERALDSYGHKGDSLFEWFERDPSFRNLDKASLVRFVEFYEVFRRLSGLEGRFSSLLRVRCRWKSKSGDFESIELRLPALPAVGQVVEVSGIECSVSRAAWFGRRHELDAVIDVEPLG